MVSTATGSKQAAIVLFTVACTALPASASSDNNSTAFTGKLEDPLTKLIFEETCVQQLGGIDALNEYMEEFLPGAVSVWNQLTSAFQVLLLFCVLQFGEVCTRLSPPPYLVAVLLTLAPPPGASSQVPNPKRDAVGLLMYLLYM